ncbi:MAG TPA: EamA family transporter [Candidatus Thermoplasmatota archaeon]|nr:EamA family transporter [Candidatus Thermoplasmatota archaeon]
MRQAAKIALFTLLCLIWGSTWLVIKVGYGDLGPFNVAAIRFLLAGLLFVPLVPAFRARWPRGRREWLLVLWVGAAMFTADYGLIYWGEMRIDSGLTAVLFATLPLSTAILAHFFVPGDRLSPRKAGGVLLAFAGVVALFGDKLRIDPSKTWPMLAIVASAIFAAAAAIASKRYGKDLHATALNAPAMIVGAILLSLVSLATGDGLALPRDGPTWGAILYLAIAGSVVTFLVYFTLLKTWNVTSLSFISVFIPIVALALGYAFLGERPSVWTGLGAAMIIGGVTLANLAHRARPPATAPVGKPDT